MRKDIQRIGFIVLILQIMVNCAGQPKENGVIEVTAAMKDVMWKGKLGATIQIDTISDREGLYGLGPLAYLKGEILILNGVQYVSRINDSGLPVVSIEEKVEAPFFVHGNAYEWTKFELPRSVISMADLEQFIAENSKNSNEPFLVKIEADVESAVYHIQNLAANSKVSSPEEAHAGQQSFEIVNKTVTIVGFYSVNHKGIFTHHDTNVHFHIITEDKTAMGHLDELSLRGNSGSVFIAEQGS